MNQNQKNILDVYSQATPAELKYGLEWYRIANREARALAAEFGCTVGTAAGIIAALSPNQSWVTNLNSARKVLQAVKDGKTAAETSVPAYGANKLKAFAIATGQPANRVLGGPKVRAFYRNILRPNSSLEVTIDGHAYSIWAGKRYKVDNETGQKIPTLTRMNRYDDIAEDYRAVARHLGLQPWAIQAVTWVVWRRLIKVWAHSQDQTRLELETAA